jgi:hypothetical protein
MPDGTRVASTAKRRILFRILSSSNGRYFDRTAVLPLDVNPASWKGYAKMLIGAEVARAERV